jgi:hypothetical protein
VTKFRAAILFAFSIGLTLTAVAFAHNSDAAPVTFSLVIHEDIDMIPVGTTFTKTVDVPLEVQGRACGVATKNGESIHTGTTATFESAGQTLVLSGIEDTPGQVRAGVLTLGATLTGTLSTGQAPDYEPGLGGYSGGAVVVSCPDVTTTTVPTATTQPPTTTLPPPVLVPPTRFTG